MERAVRTRYQGPRTLLRVRAGDSEVDGEEAQGKGQGDQAEAS